ncbi:hypothetical protein ACFXGT_33495 [Streptomyces sp. NPDC059352]|uniref:hypothetical protein n=1 Tax=Streptomyces sp. NPDC059352 TaxID=3346810 RepID=UPI0036838208
MAETISCGLDVEGNYEPHPAPRLAISLGVLAGPSASHRSIDPADLDDTHHSRLCQEYTGLPFPPAI